MTCIAHISDLHFGTVLPELAEALHTCLLTLHPDVIAVSGDLTQRAKHVEYQAAQQFLARLPFPQIVVPGNHDVPLYNLYHRFWQPLKRFRYYIQAEPYPFFYASAAQVALLGVNTARSLTIDNGCISAAQVNHIRQRFCALPPDCFKILVMHHPFIPPPQPNDRALVGRGRRLLRHLAACSPDMLLAGHFHLSYAGGTHTHKAYAEIQRSTLVIQAGTALSSRLRNESNSYNVINIDGEAVTLNVYVWTGRTFEQQRTAVYMYHNQHWRQRESAMA